MRTSSKLNLTRNGQRLWRNCQRGEASSFEFVQMIMPMVFVLGIIALAVMYWSVRIPARRAAVDCVRHAIATLEQDVGVQQGERAALESMITSRVTTVGIDAEVVLLGDQWNYGEPVQCTVTAEIDAAGLPLVNLIPSLIASGGRIIIEERVVMRIEPYKSDWVD
jgi:hypothetical protein